MKRQALMLASLCGLLILMPALARQPLPPGPITEPRGPYVVAPKAATSADPQAEEIEIMRRLLQNSLERQQHAATVPTYYQVTAAAFSPDGKTLSTEVAPSNSLVVPLILDYGFPVQKPLNTNDSIWFDPTNNGTPYTIAVQYPWQSGVQVPNSATTNGPRYITRYVTAPLTTAHGSNLWTTSEMERPGPEGVYLKGYGVVYTATLRLPTVPVVADENKPAPKPLSEWERTRRELRGEKLESSKTTPHETLADAVLKVLAKNGQHLTQLADTEQVTVALTLPRAQACTQCHGVPSSPSPRAGTAPSSTGPKPTTREQAVEGLRLLGLQAVKDDFQKQVLLGDLHMKQGKNEQAATAFEIALKLYAENLELQRRVSHDQKTPLEADAAMEKDYALTAAKLIQVYAALGKNVEMQKTLRSLEAHVQKAKASEETPKPPAPEKEELPAKLVISAPKKLLDLAGSGKITFEEFRKNATVEYQPARMIGAGK